MLGEQGKRGIVLVLHPPYRPLTDHRLIALARVKRDPSDPPPPPLPLARTRARRSAHACIRGNVWTNETDEPPLCACLSRQKHHLFDGEDTNNEQVEQRQTDWRAAAKWPPYEKAWREIGDDHHKAAGFPFRNVSPTDAWLPTCMSAIKQERRM